VGLTVAAAAVLLRSRSALAAQKVRSVTTGATNPIVFIWVDRAAAHERPATDR
jgi:hypothetical protein